MRTRLKTLYVHCLSCGSTRQIDMKLPVSDFTETLQVRAALIHADRWRDRQTHRQTDRGVCGQTDGYDKANGHISDFMRTRLKPLHLQGIKLESPTQCPIT
jgi:hypothetical protein